MGGGTIKPRFFLIVGFLIFLIACAAIYAASQGSPPNTKKLEGTVTVYILGNTGIQQVEVYIENTDQTWVFPFTELPAMFNTTINHQLDITVTPKAGYRWNGWWFSPMDIFCNQNPMPLKISVDNPFGNIISNKEIIMQPYCIKLPSTPTPQPTYTIITPPPE